jgi:hypothetical protein
LLDYIWFGSLPEQPTNNLIMPGRKVYRPTYHPPGSAPRETELPWAMDESTQTLLNAIPGRNPITMVHPWVTDWIDMSAPVEFKGYWNGFAPVVLPDGELHAEKLPYIAGAIAIRDKATKTIQSIAPFYMGNVEVRDTDGRHAEMPPFGVPLLPYTPPQYGTSS